MIGIKKLSIAGVFCVTQMSAFIGYSNKYGSVVKQDTSSIRSALVEQVVVFPKENTRSTKRITRNGLLVKYKDAQATIIICHGFMCDRFDGGFLRNLFPKGKYNFMTFDFRAHGQSSTGQYCTFGRDEACDVIAAAKFLKNYPDLKDKPLFVYGFSMGAVASIEAQARNPQLFDAMILDCPFDSSENLIKKGLDNLKVSLFGYEFKIPGKEYLRQYAYHPYVQEFVKIVLKTVAHMDATNIPTRICPINTAESIKKVSVPCFFIHCKNDQKVGVDAIWAVFRNAKGHRSLWLTNGRNHFDSVFYNPEKYSRRINNFLSLVMSGELYRRPIEKIIEDPHEVDPGILFVQQARRKE